MSASMYYKPESTFSFNEAGQTLFTIRADGTIERGEAFTTIDEMSLKFWEAVGNTRRPLVPIAVEPLQAEIERLRFEKQDTAEAMMAEIEQLRATIADLTAALSQIADRPMGLVFSAGYSPDDAEAMREIARTALARAKGRQT